MGFVLPALWATVCQHVSGWQWALSALVPTDQVPLKIDTGRAAQGAQQLLFFSRGWGGKGLRILSLYRNDFPLKAMCKFQVEGGVPLELLTCFLESPQQHWYGCGPGL